MNLYIQIHQTSSSINAKRSTLRYSIIKLFKNKEKSLKVAGKKELITYKGSLIRLTNNFSSETIESKKEWDGIFKVLKEKLSMKNSVFVKLFKTEGEIHR